VRRIQEDIKKWISDGKPTDDPADPTRKHADLVSLERRQKIYTKEVQLWLRKHKIPTSHDQQRTAMLASTRRIERHLGNLVDVLRFQVSYSFLLHPPSIWYPLCLHPYSIAAIC